MQSKEAQNAHGDPQKDQVAGRSFGHFLRLRLSFGSAPSGQRESERWCKGISEHFTAAWDEMEEMGAHGGEGAVEVIVQLDRRTD